MVLTSFEKIFAGYGAVILAGGIAFFGARARIYQKRDSLLAARERINELSYGGEKAEQYYPCSTIEYKNKFYKELAEKKSEESS